MNGGGTENEAGATLNLPMGEKTRRPFRCLSSPGRRLHQSIRDSDGRRTWCGPQRQTGLRRQLYSLTGARASFLTTIADVLEIRPTGIFQETKLGGQYTIDVPPAGFDNPLQARDYRSLGPIP